MTEQGRISRHLLSPGATAAVAAPHSALVLPALYLHYSHLFLEADCSIAFYLAYREGEGAISQ